MRLDWPGPLQTDFERSSLARSGRSRCVDFDLPGPLQMHLDRFWPTRAGRNTCREPCANTGPLQLDMSILISQGHSKHALVFFIPPGLVETRAAFISVFVVSPLQFLVVLVFHFLHFLSRLCLRPFFTFYLYYILICLVSLCCLCYLSFFPRLLLMWREGGWG